MKFKDAPKTLPASDTKLDEWNDYFAHRWSSYTCKQESGTELLDGLRVRKSGFTVVHRPKDDVFNGQSKSMTKY